MQEAELEKEIKIESNNQNADKQDYTAEFQTQLNERMSKTNKELLDIKAKLIESQNREKLYVLKNSGLKPEMEKYVQLEKVSDIELYIKDNPLLFTEKKLPKSFSTNMEPEKLKTNDQNNINTTNETKEVESPQAKFESDLNKFYNIE